MWKVITVCLICSPLLVAFQQGGAPAPLKSYNDSDAYDVYSTILPEEWTWKATKSGPLVFRDQTVKYEMCLKPDAESDKILGSAIRDYLKINETPWLLQSDFRIEKPYRLLSSAEMEKLAREQRSEEPLLRLYPGSVGWMEFSAVGFNGDKTVAVVYVGHHCGNLCGGGGFAVLQKKDGKWQPLKWNGNACVWAS